MTTRSGRTSLPPGPSIPRHSTRPRVAHTSRGRATTTKETAHMNTSEVLNKAADLIEERGWVQVEGWVTYESDANSPLCVEGAIQAASGLGRDANLGKDIPACPGYIAVESYLGMDWKRGYLWRWNDRPERTASEVIEVLRACAVIEAARESESAEVSA